MQILEIMSVMDETLSQTCKRYEFPFKFYYFLLILCILDRFDSKYDNSRTNIMDMHIIQGPFCCLLFKLEASDSSNAGSDSRGAT